MLPEVKILRESEEENNDKSACFLVNGNFREHHILSASPSFWKSLFDLPISEQDTFIITFPRVGTTLTQTILLSLLGKDFNPLELMRNSPFLEFYVNKYNGVEVASQLTPPRLFKTHVMKALMPRDFWKVKPKSIIVVRNYFDCFVSNYNFYLTNRNLARLYKDLTFDGFFENFVEKEIHETGSFFDWHASWLEYATTEGKNHCIVINYKDLVENKVNTTKIMADFLDIPYEEETVKRAEQDSEFGEMKARFDSFGKKDYVREGKVNQGVSQFSEAQRKRFEEKVKLRLGDFANLIKM